MTAPHPPEGTLEERLGAVDPQPSLRRFLSEVGRILIEVTGGTGCGLVAHNPGFSRELVQWVPGVGDVSERVQFLDRAQRDQRLETPPTRRQGSAPSHRIVRALAHRSGQAIRRVLTAPVISRGRTVALVELADPEPGWVADDAALSTLLAPLAPAFEVALLYSVLRQERFETRLLQEAGQELSRTLDLESLLGSIMDLLARIVPYDAAVIHVLGADHLEIVNQSLRGYRESEEERVRLKLGQGIVGWVARTGQAEIVSHVRDDERYHEARPETRSEMVAPLKVGGRVIGVFNLESDRSDAYTTRDLELLQTFAGQAAAALERARLLEEESEQQRLRQEVSIARRIQHTFLPHIPSVIGERGLAARTLSSKEVSGDYYDVMERPDGRLALAVADVSGKGVPAALIMSSVRAAFRIEAVEANDPAELASDVNEFLASSLRETEFVTAVFGFLDRDGTFAYVNAGHNPPLLLGEDGSRTWLETGGLVLGAFPGVTYDSGRVHLQSGDRLVLYTDGVVEAWHDERGEYGLDRLVQLVETNAQEPPRLLVNAITRDVLRFVSGPLPDDTTVMVVAGGGWD